ncbi:hypothetical protein T01_14966 [Trichinella spiralis]|uniref:Uncharacterized protein n=1 Tax=Trichinella spiralis TaxID=6334 RepID=A0A0V0YWH8_TRISP|nr:hypothetical protein T01_14966 [Trichinella spiralis]
MDFGWAGGPYTSLKVLWDEWTKGDWRRASQHWVGGGKAVGWEFHSDYPVEML